MTLDDHKFRYKPLNGRWNWKTLIDEHNYRFVRKND